MTGRGPQTTATAEAPSPWRRSVLCVVLLVAVVLAVHSPMLSIHPWGDDFENLRLAYSIHQSPWRALQPNYLFFRPMMLLMMYLNYLVSGTHPLGYNLVTLLMLVVNVLLVRALARRLGLGRWAAAAAAVLYGSSPLMSEATTWSGTRADQMMVSWCLLVVLVALGPWRPTSGRFQVATGLLLVAAAATKESWIVLPMILGATVLVVRREPLRVAVSAGAAGGVMVVVYVLYFVVWPEIAGLKTPLDYSAEVNSPLAAVAKLLRIVAWYAGLGHPEESGAWVVAAGALAAVALAAGAVLGRRRDVQLGLLLIVLPLAPTLHFPVSPTRFNALPLVGFWIAVVGLAEYLVSDRRAWQRVAAGLAAGVVALQSVLLRFEILDYRWYGELHRQLVLYVEEIEDLLPESGVVVVLNAGAFDGPGAFQRSVRGMTKYIYPKPGGMWDLVFFPSLAEFAGRPFEVRVEPVSPDRISPRMIASAVVLVFQDQGFAPCEECRDEVLRLVSAGEPLPERIGVYSFTSVGQRPVDVGRTSPPKNP